MPASSHNGNARSTPTGYGPTTPPPDTWPRLYTKSKMIVIDAWRPPVNQFLSAILPYLNLGLIVLVALGGVFFFRYGVAKTASETQDRVINALEKEMTALTTEIGSLKDRITSLEKENTRQAQILGIIKAALKKRNIIVSIDGDLVSITDAQGNSHEGRIAGHTLSEAP